MDYKRKIALLTFGVICMIGLNIVQANDHSRGNDRRRGGDPAFVDTFNFISEGRETFRYDTFGNESFWGDSLGLHLAIKGEALGGIGSGVSPATALAVGLKIDSEALPRKLRRNLRKGRVDLNDPATTVALLQLDAVVGVRGSFTDNGQLQSVGISCALCHSTVDDSFAPGIGLRQDGWASRDLNVGAIIALAPDLSPFTQLLDVDDATVRTVLSSWGPGKFDASLLLDGKAFRPDGKPAAVLIPPAFGLAGVNQHTWTGWGSVSHWNALVAVLEMGGKGTLYDPRLDNATKFPIAAANGFGNVRPEEDRVTPELAALQVYQLTLQPPTPPRGSYNVASAERGAELFSGKADCARCHVPPLYTEPGWNLHLPSEIGIDDFQARRGPEDRYRTSPLKGLWTHGKGGYFHDGRFETLLDVVIHYDTFFNLDLTQEEKDDLIEHMKSL